MSQNVDPNDLFQSAHGSWLSKASLKVLTVPDVGADINAALGVQLINSRSSEIVLVAMLIDDSSSIRMSGSSQAIRDGHNRVLQALKKTKEKNNIYVMTRVLNSQNVNGVVTPIINNMCLLDQAIELNTHNYNPNGWTPLYDQTVSLLRGVVAVIEDRSLAGQNVRAICLIVTDGRDEGSQHHTVNDIKPVVKDLLGEKHVFQAMGVGPDEGYFRNIFNQMGVPDEWIYTSNTPESGFRAGFNLFSQSAVSVSQGSGAINFSQGAGGFGVVP